MLSCPVSVWDGSEEKEMGKRVKARGADVQAGERGGDSTEPADVVEGGLKARPSLDRDKMEAFVAARDGKEEAPERPRNVLLGVGPDSDEA